MCGIAGRFDFAPGARVAEAELRAMADRIAHRGPDDLGLHVDGPLGLAHRRLSILDLSSAGHQPMSRAGGRYWIVYNGEIYNFRELRQRLEGRGEGFTSHTDTEVLLALYATYGRDCLLLLQGMYAFAIWDREERRLLLVRDPLGIKPLYYYADGARLVFASEVKAILAAPGVPREIDPAGLENYFAHGHSTAPTTIYRGIRKLPPGHLVEVVAGRVDVRPFWHPRPAPDRGHAAPWPEQVGALRELLARSVASHLVSDVPLGVFLSGGLDSSAIVALMALSAGTRIKTFSIGFDFGQRYNELDDARVVARHFATDHHEIVLRENDLRDSLETLVYHFDEPFGDPAAFPTYFVSRLARESVKVCLSGEGADELFGGYRRYLVERYGKAFRALPGAIRRALVRPLVESLPRQYRLKQLVRVLDVEDPVRRQGSWQMLFTDEMRRDLFAARALDGVDPAGVYDSFRRHRAADGSDGLNGVLFADVRSWLADCYLEKVDKASMAVSLEARVPFLDRGVVEYALGLPIDSKVKLSWDRRERRLKRVFAGVLDGLLPEAILRKPKHGFAVPLDPWFRGKLSTFIAEILFDGRTRRRGYFETAYVEKMFRDHREGRQVRNKQLWLLVLFELWHRTYLDPPAPPGPSDARHAG